MRFFINWNLFVFLLTAFAMTAQDKVVVSGEVKTQSGESLGECLVSFKNEKKHYSSVTDSLGNFKQNISPDKYHVSFNHPFVKFESVTLEVKNDTLFRFYLKDEKTELNEVIVSGSRKKTFLNSVGGNLVLNPQNMKAVPSMTGTVDIVKLLQLMPGVQNSGDANGYLYIRGGDPGHNLMLYSGTPVYGMAHLLGIFPFYNADHIEEVKFNKTNSNSKFGGRLGSSIEVFPSQKVEKRISVQGNIGLLASQATVSLPISQNSGLKISGRATYLNPIMTSINTFVGKDGKSDFLYGFRDGNLSYTSKFSDRNLLTVDVFVSGDKLRTSDETIAMNADLKWGNVIVSPTWKYTFSENTKWNNKLYFTQYNNRLDIVKSEFDMSVTSDIQDFGYLSTVQSLIGEIPFETGFQYVLHKLTPQSIKAANFNEFIQEPSRITANEASVFSSIKPLFFGVILSEIGLRLNYYSTPDLKPLLHVEPRMQFSYKYNNDNVFFASYTCQNQYVNLLTTSTVGIPTDFWIASSKGVPAQRSHEVSGGYNAFFKKKYNFLLSAYYRKMNNLLEYPYGLLQFNEITSFQNDVQVGKGEAYGLETMIKKEMGKFTGWLSYTLSWSTRKFDDLNNGEVFYSKFDRRHNFAMVGMYQLNRKWDFGLTQLFSSGSRFTMPSSWYFYNNNPVSEFGGYNNSILPNYIRTDISVNYYMKKTIEKESSLNFSLYNAFIVDNPLYAVFKVFFDESKKELSMKVDGKKLYSILPSLSWRFKF